MPQLPGQPVVVYPIAPPQGTSEVYVYADTPLVINNQNNPHDTEYTITNGKILRIQAVIVGAGKDPSEKGAKVEVIYYDGTSEHIFTRIYAGHSSLPPRTFADIDVTRDETSMVGNGGTKKLIIRRIRLSSPDQEIDVEVQAYEEDAPA